MKTKDDIEITNLLFNKLLKDLNTDEVSEMCSISNYILFVKDMSFLGDDLNNKLALIKIHADTGYVVNNNFRFNSLEVIDNKYIFYYMSNNKRYNITFYEQRII